MNKHSCTHVPECFDTSAVYTFIPCIMPDAPYELRTDRNIGWISRHEQSLLQTNVVGIAGCGGMGGQLAATLVRLGIGEIRIADTEVFDASNINRQFAAGHTTLGKSKAMETARRLRDIASDTTIVVYPMGITEESVEDFTCSCDLICDEIEFWAVGSRILLHQTARAFDVPILTAPTVGHRVYLFLFTPKSMTAEEVLEMNYKEAVELQQRLESNRSTTGDSRKVRHAMLRFALPESIPEYCTDTEIYSTKKAVYQRLVDEHRASIIATNPLFACGFLANHVLFQLLKNSDNNRKAVLPPPMPGYCMIDSLLLTTKIHRTIWW